jgi:MYXO-CTERM domain-containing protein
MIRPAVFLAIASVAGAAAMPAPARACSTIGPTPYEIDPSLQAADNVPPTLPPLSVAHLHRGKAHGACSGSTCDGLASLGIAGAATDDVARPEGVGYRMSVVAGALPANFLLLSGPTRFYVQDGTIWFSWDDGETDDQESIDFTLQVVAIDLAGNESAPQTIRVTDDQFGCAIARGHRASGRTAGFALLAVAWLAARRRRRA